MRRAATWLAVLAFSALAIAAAFDAFRGSGEGDTEASREPPSPIERPAPPDVGRFLAIARTVPPGELGERSFAAGLLDSAGLSGRLYFSDENCRLHGYRLPTLQVEPLPPVRSCAFSLSEDGWLALEETVWQPGGSLAAFCRAGWVALVTRSGDDYQRFPGCAPTWAPDGSLAYVRDGELRRWPEGRVILTGRELARAVRGREAAALPAIEQAVWVGSGALAVVARSGRGDEPGRSGEVLALYDRARGTAVILARGRIEDLAPSPQGRYLAVRVGQALRILPANGRSDSARIGLRPGAGLALAWSPDERWLAVATGGALSFLPVGDAHRRHPRLRIVARDLAWSGLGPRPYASASSATHSRSSPE